MFKNRKEEKNKNNVLTLGKILKSLHNDTIIIEFKESYNICSAKFKLITLSQVHHYNLLSCASLLECAKTLNKVLINEDSAMMFKCFNQYDYSFKDNKLTINNYILI